MHFTATHPVTQRARALRRLGLAATLALTGLGSSAQAGPLYYTFEGTIASNSSPQGTTYFADAGLTVGSAVSYTLLVDFDRQGSYTQYDGTTVTQTDHRYFWTDYIAGSALMNDSLGPFSEPNSISEYNLGFQEIELVGSLLTGSANNQLGIINNGSSVFVSRWEVGDTQWFTDYLDLRTNPTDVNHREFIGGPLTLARIAEDYTAVPVPGTLALMGLGLVGLCLRRRITHVAPLAA